MNVTFCNPNYIFMKKQRLVKGVLVAILLTIISIDGYSQGFINVTGTVTSSEDGTTIPFANVVVEGTLTGTTTDEAGRYEISLSGTETLVFSAIGFKEAKIPVNGRKTVNVILDVDNEMLDETIVVAYGTVKKSSYTGSASVVSEKVMNERPYASFTDALSSNMPGILSLGGSQPGTMPSIRVRGYGSMNASLSPLYVIDGIAVDMSDLSELSNHSVSPMTSINPSDIESITVLKDAASAALYGSRAANGVILITTKQGKSGQVKVEASALFGVSEFLYRPDLCNADEFAEIWTTAKMHNLMYNAGKKAGVDPYSYVATCYGDEALFNSYQQSARTAFNKKYVQNGQVYDFWGDTRDQFSNTDWIDEVSRLGTTQKYNLSLSGGTDKVTYFVSGEYYNLQSPMKNTGMERISARSNIISKQSRFFWFGANMNYAYNTLSGPQSDNMYANPWRVAVQLPATIPVRNEDGSYNVTFSEMSGYNPAQILANATYNDVTHHITVSPWVQLNLAPGLTLKETFSYDARILNEIRWYPPGVAAGKNNNGIYQQWVTTRTRSTSSTVLNYTKTFGRHNLGAMVAWEAENQKTNYVGGQITQYQTAYTPSINAGTLITAFAGNHTDEGMLSLISKLDYNYDEKYFLSGSYRRDGSSRFAKGHRWGGFYSVSGAWRFTKEEFINTSSWLTEGKLRASYGTSGTRPSGLYDYSGGYSFGSDYYNISGATINNVENTNLSWEKNKIFDIGLDLTFFNGRMTLEADYYDRKSDCLLIDQELSRTTGYSTATVNLGKLGNRGVELSLGGYIIERKNFQWDMKLNLAYLHNELLEYPNDDVGTYTISRVGEALHTWYLPEWAGIDKNTGEPQWYKVDDETGEKTVVKNYADATRQTFGNYNPKWSGGLSTSLSFYNFELSALLGFGLGFNVYDYGGPTSWDDDGNSATINHERKMLDNWRPDNTSSNNPLLLQSIKNGSNHSTRYLYKGDYLKLKNLKLNYTIPTDVCRSMKIKGLSIYLQAENLFLLNALNFDPEVSTAGGRYAYTWPSQRTYIIGLNFNF